MPDPMALRPAKLARARCCAECGTEFRPALQGAHAEFCGVACKRAFNNRRMVRGAELYDLVMALRCDRSVATAWKVWKLICRMVSGFRDEDVAERGGRKSWRHPREIVDRHPYLVATVVGINIAGNRRR